MDCPPHLVAERIAYWTGHSLPLNRRWAEATCGRPNFVCRAVIREHGPAKALSLAVANRGPMECIKLLLKWCPESVRVGSRRPLCMAARKGYFSVAQVLAEVTPKLLLNLDRDALINYAARHGDNPGAVELMRILLERGVSFDGYFENALHYAIRNDYLDLVTVFLDGGMPLLMPFVSLCQAKSGSLEMIVLLHKYGAPLRAGNDLLLQMAAWDGHIHIVKYLLQEHQANPDASNHTPLSKAVAAGHIHVVDTLVEFGADLHFNNEAVIFIAARQRNSAMLAHLVDVLGCNINARKGEIIQCAVWLNWDTLLHFAVSRGVSINQDNDAALCTAVEMGYTNLVALLLMYGADPNARGGKPLRSARRRGHRQVMDILLRHGAKRPRKKVRFEVEEINPIPEDGVLFNYVHRRY